jgi:ribonucleoside-triphosphate reductase
LTIINHSRNSSPLDKYLHGGYSTISLGYIGLYEVTKLMTGFSHTSEIGEKFAIKLMKKLKESCDKWKEETGIGFGLYGSPAENMCYRFAKIDKKQFGEIKDITDKGYYTNSYHVDVREKIDMFDKFRFESQFQSISTGGCISYCEIPYIMKNLKALEDAVKFIYENIQYAEFNTKSDFCQACNYQGEIQLDDDHHWYCPNCGNRDENTMTVTRRTCGYCGTNYWNYGKTVEIGSRVMHVGD